METVAHLGDPAAVEATYQRQLLATASAVDPVGDHTLGLMRIAYEARCRLTATIDSDSYLRISAMVMPPPRKSR
jgi:hypothetical protein